MVHRTAPPRRQRVAVLVTVFVLHAALLGLFLRQAVDVAPVVRSASIAMIAVDAERPAAAKPPPPALPAKIAETFKPVVVFSIPTDTESDAPAGATGVCSTAGAVLDAVLLDVAALDAIRAAPPETRSIADAVVIWNAGWSPATIAPEAPLFTVRATIEQTLSAISESCLDEPIAGPRLFPIPDAAGTKTIFLVFGSGEWTWRALLIPPITDGSETAQPAPAPPAPTL